MSVYKVFQRLRNIRNSFIAHPGLILLCQCSSAFKCTFCLSFRMAVCEIFWIFYIGKIWPTICQFSKEIFCVGEQWTPVIDDVSIDKHKRNLMWSFWKSKHTLHAMPVGDGAIFRIFVFITCIRFLIHHKKCWWYPRCPVAFIAACKHWIWIV